MSIEQSVNLLNLYERTVYLFIITINVFLNQEVIFILIIQQTKRNPFERQL